MACRAITFFVVSSLAFSASAFAQDVGCQRRAGAVCGAGDSGRVLPLGAGANVSRGGDFTPIKTAARLRPGDRVLGGASGARLELGQSCSTKIAPGSLATITGKGNLICASEFEKTPKGVGELGDNDDKLRFVPFGDHGTAASIGAIALIGAGIGVGIYEGNRSHKVSAR